MLVALTLLNEPPKTTNASELNKQEQPEATTQEREVVVEPQSEEKAKEKVAPQPKPKPKPVTYPKGCGHYATLIQKYFGAKAYIAARVAKAESGCNPSAVGDNYPIRGLHAPSCGLFQIRTLNGRPSCLQLKDPETNVKWAKKLYLASGWQPWSVCRNGMARCY